MELIYGIKDKPSLGKVILFAPTFRGSGRKSAYYPENYIDLDVIYKNLDSIVFIFFNYDIINFILI